MTFGNWDEKIHNDVEQVGRLNTGLDIKAEKVTVSSDTQTAVIIGSSSEAYKVSLENCDCEDFRRRKLPCKHMYRLAYELGCFSHPKRDVSASKTFDATVPEKIKELEELYLSGVISGKKYVAIVKALKSK